LLSTDSASIDIKIKYLKTDVHRVALIAKGCWEFCGNSIKTIGYVGAKNRLTHRDRGAVGVLEVLGKVNKKQWDTLALKKIAIFLKKGLT
jgi:hypothetical protein